MIKFLKNPDIFEKSWFWPKLSKNFDLGGNFWKFWFWSKFPEIAIFVEIFLNRELGRYFRKITILVEIF